MGQMTTTIMYGIPDVKGVELFDGEHETNGLVDRYRKHLDAGWGDDRVPDRPYESELPALGWHVAIGASGKDGVPDLEPFAWDDLEKVYKTQIAKVKAHWKVFSNWAKKQGVNLPTPQFYLTEDEVA